MPALSPALSGVFLIGWIGAVCGLLLALAFAELVVLLLLGVWEDLTRFWRLRPERR